MVTMTETIKADIKGTVSGQVAVSNYILQTCSTGSLNISSPSQSSTGLSDRTMTMRLHYCIIMFH
jgi:hypothetical protein